jgi:regulator of sigma E protease
MAHLPPFVLSIAGFVIVVGVLIFVHELGHFLAAKSVGIGVIRFSFGLGPRTPLRRTVGETEYCLSWLPLGGYVKMAGLEEEGVAGQLEGPPGGGTWPKERTFEGKPLWARVYVIAAGVVMNALFAVLVYGVLAGTYGVPEDRAPVIGAVDTTSLPLGAAALARLRPGDRIVRINGDTVEGWSDVVSGVVATADKMIRIEVAGGAEPVVLEVPASEHDARAKVLGALSPWVNAVIGSVVAGGPADRAGIQPGDRIVRADTVAVRRPEDFTRVIEAHPGRPVALVVQRGGADLPLTVTPLAESERDPSTGVVRQVGKVRVGVSGEQTPLRRYHGLGAVGQGFAQAGQAAGLVLFTLKGLVVGQLSLREVGGPIFIGQISGEVARLGLEPFLSFLALFSMNLAVLNLLPIPVLDGGHLLFLAIEGVRRKPLSERVRLRWTQVGFAVLVAIMLLALANDVLRLVK